MGLLLLKYQSCGNAEPVAGGVVHLARRSDATFEPGALSIGVWP